MNEVFPAHEIAVDWSDVAWTDFQHVVVSGPQRSGTTAVATMLAEVLGGMHIDEDSDAVVTMPDGRKTRTSGWDEGMAFIRCQERTVTQAPGLSSILHTVEIPVDTIVVFLARNCLDVFRSQNRIMKEQVVRLWGSVHIDLCCRELRTALSLTLTTTTTRTHTHTGRVDLFVVGPLIRT